MIDTLRDVISWLYYIVFGLLLVRVFLSWIPVIRGGGIAEFVFAFTEPVLAPVRKYIDRSPLGGPGLMFDFSPVVAFFLLRFLRNLLESLLLLL